MKPQGKLYQERLTGEIIGAAIEVHRQLGPGLLESTYAACLCRELELRGISFECQKPLPLEYKGVRLDWLSSRPLGSGLGDCRDQIGRSASAHPRGPVADLFETYWVKIGLLINFNVVVLKSGIRRLVH